MKENARERITSSFQKHAYWTPSPYNMENATSCLLPSFSPYQYRSFRFQRSRRRCLSKDRPHIGKNDYRGVYTIKVQDSWRLLIHAHNLVTAHFFRRHCLISGESCSLYDRLHGDCRLVCPSTGHCSTLGNCK